VNQNAAQLCPDPWRVPTKDDFEALVAATNATHLAAAWGYGGRAFGSGIVHTDFAYYWSSTENDTNSAYNMYNTSGGLPVDYTNKYLGMQVRCVK
jgi:hypothetical protein